jgi:hypothetical protein
MYVSLYIATTGSIRSAKIMSVMMRLTNFPTRDGER